MRATAFTSVIARANPGLKSLQWFDEESGDSGLTSNTGMSYFYTLVNTTKCGPAQRQARAEFIQGCKDDEEFLDQYVLPPICIMIHRQSQRTCKDDIPFCVYTYVLLTLE